MTINQSYKGLTRLQTAAYDYNAKRQKKPNNYGTSIRAKYSKDSKFIN